MSAEQLQTHETYSGKDFLRDLEIAWGGKLYFGLRQSYQEQVVNIKPASQALRDVIAHTLRANPSVSEITITAGNLASTFQRNVLSGMPHPDEARDFIHLLADPCCRHFLRRGLEVF